MNDSFPHIPDRTVRYSIICVGDVTKAMTHAVQIVLKKRLNSALYNVQMVVLSKWIYKNWLISHSNSSK